MQEDIKANFGKGYGCGGACYYQASLATIGWLNMNAPATKHNPPLLTTTKNLDENGRGREREMTSQRHTMFGTIVVDALVWLSRLRMRDNC